MARVTRHNIENVLGGVVSGASLVGAALAVHYAGTYVSQGDSRFFPAYAAMIAGTILTFEGRSVSQAVVESVARIPDAYRTLRTKLGSQ